MRTFAQKPKSAQQAMPAKSTIPGRSHLGQNHEVRSILHLQRTIGNQAVQRLLQVNDERRDYSPFAGTSPRFAHDFSRTPVLDSAGTIIHPKLRVGVPGEKYEQEAERVADQVMRMDEQDRSPEVMGISDTHNQTGSDDFIQRLSADRSPSFEDAIVVEEEESEERTVQTLRPQNQLSGTGVVSKQQLDCSQSGVPLEPNARQFMETRFGADFRAVKIHADGHAGALCNSLNARAFTYGSSIYFGNNEYQPNSQDGKCVLAHELTHVVQQGASKSHSPTMIQRLSARGRVLRHGVAPWGAGGPVGTDYEVTTDGGSTIPGWQAYSPYREQYRYWCHGHSTDSYINYDYSVYSGSGLRMVIADEYKNIPPAQTRAGDIAVWTQRMDHSAKFTDAVKEHGNLVSDRSLLSTKNGQAPLTTMTLTQISGIYGTAGIAVYRHK